MNSVASTRAAYVLSVGLSLCASRAAGMAPEEPASAALASMVPFEAAPGVNSGPVTDSKRGPEPHLQDRELAPAAGEGSDIIGDSHLDLLFRNYAAYFKVDNVGVRQAWIQAMRAEYSSGFTSGAFGVGLDAALFTALKLDGGNGAGNMVHIGPHGGGQDQKAWAYLGGYVVKARSADTVVKFGLQAMSNPFLEPNDIRALPPSYRGISMVSKVSDGVMLDMGSVDAIVERGSTYLRPLRTAYGSTQFDRLSYLGGKLEYPDGGKILLYASQASAVWNQYYASGERSVGVADRLKWKGKASIYRTRDQGASIQGGINNTAFSLALSAEHGASTLMISYQRMVGEQFMDFIKETDGIFLSNAIAVDYNAPHEQSLQLAYTWSGKASNFPGLGIKVWGVTGWGADATTEADKHSALSDSLHTLYWMNGKPVQGSHHEFGLKQSYVVQQGILKNSKISLIMSLHMSTQNYPDRGFRTYWMMYNVPVKGF